VEMANRLREAERFCEQFGLPLYRAGEGISHQVALELGWFAPGSIVLGSDSHTCMGGVMQSLALGMGASDITAAMVTGETWLEVPETVCLDVVGAPGPHVSSKDLLLAVLARFPDETFLYKSVQWTGPWLEALSFDSAATIANMAVEMGAKNAFLPPGPGRMEGLVSTEVGDQAQHLEFDIERLTPYVARPHAPSSAVPIDDCRGQKIDFVYVGSCTNSRLEDFAEVARILDGRQVHPKVTLVMTPGSKQVLLDALQHGYAEKIIRAGGLLTPPGCGSCLGTQGPVPATGDRVLSTMNRNFRGRMGNRDAEIFLASPHVAAHTALRGEIPGSEDLT
jgi:3-isopropylmalate/(R)-2-methylmalate dehydratase large subunit